MARITIETQSRDISRVRKFPKQPNFNVKNTLAGISRHESGGADRWCSCRVWALRGKDSLARLGTRCYSKSLSNILHFSHSCQFHLIRTGSYMMASREALQFIATHISTWLHWHMVSGLQTISRQRILPFFALQRFPRSACTCLWRKESASHGNYSARQNDKC